MTNGEHGQVSIRRYPKNVRVTAHALSWHLTGRAAPAPGEWMVPTCGTPLCVHPDHWRLGAKRELPAYSDEAALKRFWSKVARVDGDGCWEWQARRSDRGYGQFTRRGVFHSTHRFSWEAHYGDIPEGLYVCHHCDNPPCVRPAHLFLGDHSLNAWDASLKAKQQVTAHNEGDLLVRLSVLRSEAQARRDELQAAREQRRSEMTRRAAGLGLAPASPDEIAERRRIAAEGLRIPAPMYFTDDEIRHIRAVPRGAGVIAALSSQYGISRQGIHAIRSRTTYAHVSDSTVRPDPGPDLTRKEATP